MKKTKELIRANEFFNDVSKVNQPEYAGRFIELQYLKKLIKYINKYPTSENGEKITHLAFLPTKFPNADTGVDNYSVGVFPVSKTKNKKKYHFLEGTDPDTGTKYTGFIAGGSFDNNGDGGGPGAAITPPPPPPPPPPSPQS